MINPRLRLLYDACRQSRRDGHGANCPACTLYDMCERQLRHRGRAHGGETMPGEALTFNETAHTPDSEPGRVVIFD